MSTRKRHIGPLLVGTTLTAAMLVASAAPASAQAGEIVFHEGGGGDQYPVATLDDTAGQFVRPSQNDEARSVVLYDVRAGAVITVYDDKKGKRSDDHAVITVKQTHPEYIVRTFERTYEDEYVKVRYVRYNGLDGKVSAIRVD